jgi:hypothetical protein
MGGGTAFGFELAGARPHAVFGGSKDLPRHALKYDKVVLGGRGPSHE